MTRTLFVADRIRTGTGTKGDAVLVEDGAIVRTGAWREMNGETTDVVHYAGCTIVPGFRDAHLHPVGLAASRTGLDLTDVTDFDQLTDRIRAWAGRLPPHAAVVGTGLDDERLAEGRMPAKADLDAVLSARPIVVYRHCSHIASANSVALARAGIDTTTLDPPGGRIDRTVTGAPTGVLRETAIGLVTGVLGSDIPGPDAGRLIETLNGLARDGITAIDAIVSADSPMWCGTGNELDLLCEAGPAIVPRVAVYIIASSPNELRQAAARVEEAGLGFGGWKGFADGSLGGHTALLSEPYSDRPDTHGLDRWSPSSMRTMAETALELGGRAAIHAIGDAAVDRAVALAEDIGAPVGSIRIEHASVVDRTTIERMASEGVVASVQPSFVLSDAPFLLRRLGPDRIRNAYPFRTMMEAGVSLIAGSDAPIEDPRPLAGIAAAMHRGGLQGAESLDLDAALAIHTAHTLSPGDPADLVIVEGDITSGDMVPVAVVIEGEVVQDRRWGATSEG